MAALYELSLGELKALYAEDKLSRDDLFRKDEDGTTVLHWLAKHKYALSIFPWLVDLKWITKDDLFIKDEDGDTVFHCFADNKDALFIFQWLKDLKWITKDDLFIKDEFGTTILDFLSEEDQKKVLALFDKKETSKSESITDEMINKIREHLKAINNILTFNEE